jgi:hypothetical protein
MVRFAGYARKKEPKWPYVGKAFIILMGAAAALFIFSALAQWLEAEANKPVAVTTTTTTSTTSTTVPAVPTTTLARLTTTTVPAAAAPASASGIKISQIVIASGLDNANQPVDDLSKVPVDEAGRLYCYTRLSNEGNSQPIRHVWVGPGGRVAAEIELTARSGSSATWSYINITGQRAGQWQVRVEAKDGTVLARRAFGIY